MKLNKILSLVLSVVLIISALSCISYANDAALGMEVSEMPMLPVVTEEEEPKVDENVVIYGKDSVEFLNALNITQIAEETLAENIKRADFLKMMNIAGGYGTDKGTTQIFVDLPLTDEREPYVRALYNLGIIAPDASGKIYPDAEISMQEAVAIAVKITGYSLVAEAKGGYPTGYFNVGKSNGILKGVPGSAFEVVTVGMAAKILENTLKSQLMVQNFGTDSAFEEYKGTNLLNQVFGIYTYQNVVKGVDISRVSGANDLLQFTMDIGGNVIDASDILDAHSWLGYNVVAYYTNERGDIPRLKFLQKTILNEETIIDFEDIVLYSNGRIKIYDENDREKYYSCSSSLPLIYNSVSSSAPFSQSMIDALKAAGKNGVIRILDNNGDGTPDVVFADVYESYVVSFADTDKNIVYDRYDNTNSTVIDVKSSDDYAVLYKADGEEGDITDISVDSVIAIYDSAPYTANQSKKIIRVVENEISGTISSLKKNGDIVIIDEVEYDVLAKAKAKFSHILTPGNEVTLKLDLNGNVIWVERKTTDFRYGFISAVHSGTGSLSDELVIKMYALDNKRLDVYEVAENVIIDDNKYSDASIAAARLDVASKEIDSLSTSKASIVRFKLNDKSQITCIDTILKKGSTSKADRDYANDLASANDTLFIEKATVTDYAVYNQILGETTFLEKNGMALVHPAISGSNSDLQDVDNYNYVTHKSVLVEDKDYSGASSDGTPLAYAVFDNGKNYFSKLVCLNGIVSASQNLSINNPCYIFDEVYDIYDEKDDKAIKMVALLGPTGEKIEIPVEDLNVKNLYPSFGSADISSFKKGDMVMYATDNEGKLSGMDVFYSPYNKKSYNSTILGSFDNALPPALSGGKTKTTVKYAYVYDKFDGGIIVCETNSETDFHDPNFVFSPSGTMKYLRFQDDRCSAPVLKYTTGRGAEKEVKLLSQGGLKTYKDVGADCSRIVIHYYTSSVRTIYEIDM